jgi:hypothetical protein
LPGLEPGPHRSIPNLEDHNTSLDLFAQGGLLADLSFLWVMASTILIGYRAGLDALTIMVGSRFLFGLFQLIIRQPVFWYGICHCLAASGDVGTGARQLQHALGGQRGTVSGSPA